MKTVRVCVWTLVLLAGSLKPAFSQTPEGLLESPSTLLRGLGQLGPGGEELQPALKMKRRSSMNGALKLWISAVGIGHSSCLTM